MSKSHVQRRGPGVIFRLDALRLSTGPGNAFANGGAELAV
jgi:hypothetical protein